MAEQGGTIFRGPDGSLYFIRDEILEACKLSGDELEKSERVLAESRAGDGPRFQQALTVAGLDAARHVRAMPELDFKKVGDRYSTVMCCW
jgi:hypothetical protein